MPNTLSISPFQGLLSDVYSKPRALPWANLLRPFRPKILYYFGDSRPEGTNETFHTPSREASYTLGVPTDVPSVETAETAVLHSLVLNHAHNRKHRSDK